MGGIGLLLLFLQSAWYPTVHVRSWRSQRPAVRIDLAIDAASRAAEADPFDPAPRAALVEYRFQEIMESRRKGLATQVIEQQYRSAIEKWVQAIRDLGASNAIGAAGIPIGCFRCLLA